MSETYQRTIKFYYYRPKVYKKPDNEENEFEWKYDENFDVSNWLAEISRKGNLKSNIELNDCIVNLERIEILEKNLYAFRIYKLRESNIPSKIKEGEEATPIDLEPDEYVGEDTTLLYDSSKCILMMQHNRMSVGKSRLERLMTDSLNNPHKRVLLKPISRRINVSGFRNKRIKTIEFSMENLDLLEQSYRNNGIMGLVQGFSKYSGYSCSIKISASRKKEDTLNLNNTIDALTELTNNKELVNKAKVRLKDDERSRIEEVDLFEDLLHDIITFSIDVRSPLSFEYASMQMLRVYKERLDELKNLVY